jgi:RNA polymerase sigma-70 factor (ECF subfamily)
MLVGYAMQWLSSLPEAEDVVQNVIIRLWDKKIVFDNINVLKSYLITSVRNEVINSIRGHERQRKNYDRYKNQQKALNGKMDEEFFTEELYRRLFELVDRLPAQQKKVFLMAMEGKKNSEIAQLLNISSETVRKHKRHAIAFLKENIDDKTLVMIIIYLSHNL